MHYLTRHLEALRDLPIGEALVPVGGRFYATDVDADYLVKSKRAAEVGGGLSPVAEARAAAPAIVAAPAVDVAAPAVAPQPDPAHEEPSDSASEEAAPPKPRRGRPSNADRLARQSTEPADSPTDLAAEAGADTAVASAA